MTGVVSLDLYPSAMPETSNPAVRERTDQPPQTLIIPPDDGDTIHADGDTALLVKLSGQQTNGSMVVEIGRAHV